MNSTFYLFIPRLNASSSALDSVELTWVFRNIHNELKLERGTLSKAAHSAIQHHVTVVLAGEDILFLTADVPGKNQQRVQQAIPYVLEDSVIDDVDNLHFAISKPAEDSDAASANHYQVSVINKHYFESILNQLENAGIQIDAVTVDYLLLQEGKALALEADRVVINSAELKFTSDIESVLSLEDYLPSNDSIKFIQCEKGTSENVDLLINKYNFKKDSCESHPLVHLVKNRSNNIINLLQGRYKKKKNWSQTGKTWLPVAALFLIWLIVQGILFVVDYASLSGQNQKLNEEITQIYKKTFPKSRRIIDAKAQMQQKLSSLKKRKGQSGRSFTEMLAGSANIISKRKGLKIKSLRYYDGRINLELELSSLQSLEQLKKQLNSEKGYEVEIQNASSGKDKVTARLQIIGAAL